MNECKICGNHVGSGVRSPDGELCRECQALEENAERLINKNPGKAVHYFTDLFMRARRLTKSEEKLKNCIWEAWWKNQKEQLPN